MHVANFHQSRPKMVTRILLILLAVPHAASGQNFRRGMCWGHGKTGFYNGLYNYASSEANASLRALAITGTNSVQIETAWYVDRCNSTSMHPASYTPSDAALLSAMSLAHDLGMEVMLNAHLEVACKYDASCAASCGGRNDINFGSDTEAWDAWFESYTAFIVHQAKICEAAKSCALLAVHVELQDIGGHLHDIGLRWERVINATRQHFSGQLTASCNGSPGISGTFALNQTYWGLLDVIGIDSFPAVNGLTVEPTDVSAAFTTLLHNLKPLVIHTGRKLLFTQVGYPSCSHCGQKGAHSRFPAVDEDCQARAYEGILNALMDPEVAELVDGLYFWNWLPCVSASKACAIGSADNAESPQGKAAEIVVRKYYTNRSRLSSKFV